MKMEHIEKQECKITILVKCFFANNNESGNKLATENLWACRLMNNA